ncbi:hypothetical protein [Streptomyces griseocarneus]|uniref:hypothetical protein n=1 Tax=Streptomyces griseocarneus TaxID=51201 RepID=UPI00167CBE1B|nr:hypothetical protein [Streptomyces griseocarneus]MBZ6476795.1 hypothetical protein [Streptomyces griseocarneus]GHG81399.1 hypothetical protein GCM10018779_63560 [Streptomyces griseocarneus]
MPTHSIMPGRHVAHEGPGPVPRTGHVRHEGQASRAGRVVPVVGGVVLGLYAVFLAHDNGYSEAGGWVLGIIAGAIAAALGYAVIHERNRMITEVRAAAFGALFGVSMGFLRSLSGATVLDSCFVGLAFGLGMGLTSYYIFYWHEH